MSKTLQQHIADSIQDVFKRYDGAWIVWCDPRGDWLPLLQRTQKNGSNQEFPLISIQESTGGHLGSPGARKQLQEHIDSGKSFVLHVNTTKEELGWLWAQALLAEQIQDRSLRQKLRDWGWHPQNINTSDDDIVRLARQNLQLPLTEWGGGKIAPEPHMLLEVLAGSTPAWYGKMGIEAESEWDENSSQDKHIVFDLTVTEAGLPALVEEEGTPARKTDMLERWRLEALAHLLVTQAHQATPQFFAHHEYLIVADKRAFALKKVLERWLDSVRLSKGLPDRILDADRILVLGNYFAGAELTESTYLSQTLERALFANVCARLTALSGRDLLEEIALLGALFERHAQAFWGDKHESNGKHAHSLPWGELARLSGAVKTLLDAAPGKDWNNIAEAVSWYTWKGWRVEQAGEEIMRQVSKPTTELLNFITPLREAYYYHWENYLIQWSHLWQQAGCPLPSLESQGEWLKQQLKDRRATAVIVLDALRYDIGMTLKQQVNTRQGTERAEVFPARTALPTITALGMGMALPIDESELRAEIVNGKWQLFQKGESLNLSIAENRREWLKSHLKVAPDALLALGKHGPGNIPAPTKKNARLFLFDDTLDKLGHDEELEPLGTLGVQERYIQTIEQLRDKGWTRVLVVTDHGFIHWPGNNEQHVPLPMYDPAYTSRRALAYPKGTVLQGLHAPAPGREWIIAVPNGAECFRTYGGLGYFHGGASLQEWIVPCLKIEWPVSAKPVSISIQPMAQLLSLRSKVTLIVQHESLFDDNALPREVELTVRDQQQRTIFRSQRKVVTPNQDQETLMLEPVEDMEAARGTAMIMELRDTHTNEVIAIQTTILMVDLENW